jgi:hypothetical protein
MATDREAVFVALRETLRAHRGTLSVGADTPVRFCLEASVGPATLAAWGGRVRRRTIPVAWVECGKANVSLHLMGLAGNPALLANLSPSLRARLQGKTCFGFRTVDDTLIAELDAVTGAAIAGFRRAGFIAD